MKGSDTCKNEITGDSQKDTSGPAMNTVMRPTAIPSPAFGSQGLFCTNCWRQERWSP